MLIRGDARALPLVDGSVDCVVTSPPYFGLRDYGHAAQIGLEPSPEAYVAQMVKVFREIERVLKPTGTVWGNWGDSYASSASGRTQTGFNARYFGRPDWNKGKQAEAAATKPSREIPKGLKAKDLLMIPARVALALQADGWYLRSDIIWSKPNPMPESVTDRPTKAHEYIFLLSKNEKYFYDADAIRENCVKVGTPLHLAGGSGERAGTRGGLKRPEYVKRYTGKATKDYEGGGAQDPSAVKTRIVDKILSGDLVGRNRRSVWEVPPQPYDGAHFATMPEKLVEPCILAGCPPGGVVLDPFVGSGTVVAVAERLGRCGIGVDLAYQDLSKERTAQRGLYFGSE